MQAWCGSLDLDGSNYGDPGRIRYQRKVKWPVQSLLELQGSPQSACRYYRWDAEPIPCQMKHFKFIFILVFPSVFCTCWQETRETLSLMSGNLFVFQMTDGDILEICANHLKYSTSSYFCFFFSGHRLDNRTAIRHQRFSSDPSLYFAEKTISLYR